ncbi:hypothetical protein Tco_0805284 [Tanacetum coccineum]
MNEKGIDSSKNKMVKEEDKEEESTRKRKLGTRKKMKSRKRRFRQNTSEDDSEKENDELRLCLTIAPDEDKEVDYEILDKKYPIIEWRTEYLGTKPQVDKAKHLKEINQNVVIISNGQKRYFITPDEEYQDEMPEGFDKVLWGDLMVMFNPDDEDKFWNSQQDWNIKNILDIESIVANVEIKVESEEDILLHSEMIIFSEASFAELEPEDSMEKRRIFKVLVSKPTQQMVISFTIANRPKNLRQSNEALASQKQTYLVKTNHSLMVDSIPKTVWLQRSIQQGTHIYQQKVNLTAPTITFPGIEKHKMFSIIAEPSLGRDVKHGYMTPSLSKEDVEYLQLFEEEIEERLKHHDEMRRWEMYVNGRPLGSRRERPE